jgi:chromosome segregation ATPase
MIHGRDQLAIIDQHIATAQSSVDAIHRRLEEAGRRLTEIRNQTAEEFRRLAKFRLDELTAKRVIARLDETDRAVMELLQRRGRELGELEAEIQRNLARQAELKSEREEAVRRRDELVTEIDRHAAELRAQLVAQAAYRTQAKNAREAAARAERAETKAAQAEADREEKGRPYREDALFMYLWNRRFLTPEYNGGGLTRALDGWVAKRIRYADARSNYFILTELPLRLREHAERQKTIAAQESQKLLDLEEQALQGDGIRPKKEALLAVKKEIEGIEARVEAEEKRHEALSEKRAAYSAASDELSQQAIQLQVSEIRNDTLSNLYREAQATSRPDDDVIVSRIQGLMAEEQSLSAEIGNLQSELQRQQKSFQEIEELRRRFRRSGYDSGHSYFPGGLDVAALLALLLSGRASGGDVWGRIGREQEFRLPRQHRHGRERDGGFFPGGFGGGRGLPDIFGGGSGGGGTIGGGGFRTGGGF